MPRPKPSAPAPKKRGPGRPKTSPLDAPAQARERQARLRAKKREAGRVVVQLWINAKWHAAILKSGATLQDSADEAFALLMAKRRGKSR
jgi:hypothetical protein